MDTKQPKKRSAWWAFWKRPAFWCALPFIILGWPGSIEDVESWRRWLLMLWDDPTVVMWLIRGIALLFVCILIWFVVRDVRAEVRRGRASSQSASTDPSVSSEKSEAKIMPPTEKGIHRDNTGVDVLRGLASLLRPPRPPLPSHDPDKWVSESQAIWSLKNTSLVQLHHPGKDHVYGWEREMAEHYLNVFASRYPEAVREGENGMEYQPEVLKWWASQMYKKKTTPKGAT